MSSSTFLSSFPDLTISSFFFGVDTISSIVFPYFLLGSNYPSSCSWRP